MTFILSGNGVLIGMARGRDVGYTRVFCIDAFQPIILCRGMASNAVTATMNTSNLCDKVLTKDNVFVNLRKMEFAVRGPLFIRALEIEKELQKVRIK